MLKSLAFYISYTANFILLAFLLNSSIYLGTFFLYKYIVLIRLQRQYPLLFFSM